MPTKPPTGSDLPPTSAPEGREASSRRGPLPKGALVRLERTLRQKLRHGCKRAVFSRPGPQQPEQVEEQEHEPFGDDEAPHHDDALEGSHGSEPEVIELSDAQAWDDAALRDLVDRARAAAVEGRVKQVYWLDERTRLRVDARHGHGKLQTLDDATVLKMMGGKDRVLRPDRSARLLRVIGISNADGTISPKKAKKYKQINHFVELCRPLWERLVERAEGGQERPLQIVDLGCGNGYLTFALAEALRIAEVPADIVGVDRRADVIERANARASELGFSRLRFVTHPIAQYRHEGDLDLVMALHACDTATDEAIAIAISHDARAILAAPCCQAELAVQLEHASEHEMGSMSGDDADANAPERLPIPALGKLPLLRREYAALLTDAFRAEALSAFGYRVDTLEFVGSEHTPKNLLLRGVRMRAAGADALGALRARAEAIGVRPALLTLLGADRAG